MIGRPSLYSPELALVICGRLAEGETLRAICRDEAMPDRSTVFRWLADPDHAGFRDQYARAREVQADTWGDEILEIADDATFDVAEWTEKGPKLNSEFVRRSQLRVDARKWLMGKSQPRKYGDKVAVESSGPDGGPIKLEHDVAAITDATRARALHAFLAKAKAAAGAPPPAAPPPE